MNFLSGLLLCHSTIAEALFICRLQFFKGKGPNGKAWGICVLLEWNIGLVQSCKHFVWCWHLPCSCKLLAKYNWKEPKWMKKKCFQRRNWNRKDSNSHDWSKVKRISVFDHILTPKIQHTRYMKLFEYLFYKIWGAPVSYNCSLCFRCMGTWFFTL